MNYSEKLKHPNWQKKRLEILQRDNFTCQICTDTETELHVHHLKYTGEPFEATNEDLQTLCKRCHKLETFYNKRNDSIISIVKLDTVLIGKLKSGNIFLSLDDSLNGKSFALTIDEPEKLLEILESLIK